MTRCTSSRPRWSALVIALVAATAAPAQTTPAEKTGQEKSPERTPTQEQPAQPAALAPAAGRPVVMGPTREVKLADYTWFRFGFQVQAWYRAAQDRPTTAIQTDSYAQDFYCRRCRLFATGSVVKDVTFNILFEASNFGRADPATGAKSFAAPNLLDAYAQVKFAEAFQLSAGSILLPLTRNGTQPTTTYLSIDNANVDTTPIGQGNTQVIRDLGVQINGFLLGEHLEYRLGMFQGSRAPAILSGTTVVQTAGHNPFRFVASLSYNFWDTEKGYVNGGHYYGAKRVFGVMLNGDTQWARTIDPSFPPAAGGAGASKDPYYGVSGAVFMNFPLSGASNPRGGDEIVWLLQAGYYDGGAKPAVGTAAANPGTYSLVPRQFNFLAEAAYYNHTAKFSVFGKYEMRKINAIYPAATAAASNITWIAGGLKYYIAPANLLNIGLQYERIIFPDAPSTASSGTNNIVAQMQLLLY